MSNLTDLTVIIVTYKTNYQILHNCISSIHKDIKIINVENSDNVNHKIEIEKLDQITKGEIKDITE